MTTFDKSKPKPAWLDRSRFGGKHGTYRARWYNHLWNAQPAWADRRAIAAVYRRCKRLRKSGFEVEVDHVVPLFHPLICGLHVRSNLRIVDRDINGRKSNRYFPGMPFAQRDLFEQQIAPADFELEFQNAEHN